MLSDLLEDTCFIQLCTLLKINTVWKKDYLHLVLYPEYSFHFNGLSVW